MLYYKPMRQSHLFTKTRKDAPADEVSTNAQLLIRAGYIHKEMAGVYSLLPLGLRVFSNITKIIREEMNTIGGQEISMTALQEKELWEKTGRWSDESIDVWFKTTLKNGTELGLGTTHEEPITRIAAQYVSSYKDLPFSAYQFQTKFRNEVRAKSGIMRTREFVMKDLYSFHTDQTDLDTFYEKAAQAYQTIFNRAGIGDKTYKTFASGGSFSKYSHEFQTLCEAGEDTIYVHEANHMAVNKEVYTDDVLKDLGVSKDELVEAKAIEVGNIFQLGTRFSEVLGLSYTDESGEKKPVIMGCYGIGPARLMGTIVELLADDKGLVWPVAVAPFRVHLLSLGISSEVKTASDKLYDKLTAFGVDTLYDDRDLRPGEKFADSDLIGIPLRVIVSEKTLKENKFEVKGRTEDTSKLMDEQELLHHAQTI